jgi:hypothetical protein
MAIRLADSGFQIIAELRKGILHPQQFPELAVDVASIWPQ